ncbi:MAG: response regulator, partial [Bacteroidota bacterium]
ELKPIDAAHMKLMLNRKGWDSDSVSTSSELMHKMATGNYELVLISNNLADSNAEELAREIRKLHKNLPIIAITSYSIEAEKRKLLQAGADICLTKPVYNHTLNDVISNITGQENILFA